MRTVACFFALLCTVYSLRIIDPIEVLPRPYDPIEVPPRPYKGCLYEGKFYQVGQFKPNDCMFCDCQTNGEVSCAIMDCARPQCPNPVRIPGQCCPVCRGYYGPQEPRPLDSSLAIP